MAKTIALLTMSLDIGGAETHVYELACALHNSGHDVTVFSNGGVFADKLVAMGIAHVLTPLHSKSLKNLFKSYKILKRYVKQNPYSVIHSHTRISNFVAMLITKRYRIPFVTTVHFDFSAKFFRRLFSKWGEYSLAVSDDLREYLAKKYGYNRKNIAVTTNGINLKTFMAINDFVPNRKAQLCIPPENKTILCVSRLDAGACEHVRHVLRLAPEIFRRRPLSTIVIVGGGKLYDEFCVLAEEINRQTRKDFVILTGPQTEINSYLRFADLFIGISRSALEAMACKIPCVLLGNSGYLGIFERDKTQKCMETNFTCRGCPFVKDEEILELICDVLENTSEYTKNIIDGYRLIKEKYSISIMRDDALRAYQIVQDRRRPIDIMLSGYYGRSNLGDDLTLRALISNVSDTAPINGMVVLTANKKIGFFSEKINKIHRFDILGIIKAMKTTKLFMLGGGSLLQDATSARSLVYYLFITRLAIHYGCKTMLYGNGVGPISRKSHRKMTKKVLSRVSFISLRDNASAEFLGQLGIYNPNIIVTADETFTIGATQYVVGENTLFTVPKGKVPICINIRNIYEGSSFQAQFSLFVNKLAEDCNAFPVLLPIHFEQDDPSLRVLAAKLKCEYYMPWRPLTHSQTLSVIQSCEISICERLHGLIFSSVFKKPFIAINYDPKVAAFVSNMNMSEYMLDAKNFTVADALVRLELLISNKENISSALDAKIKLYKEGAQQNAKIAADLLDKYVYDNAQENELI